MGKVELSIANSIATLTICNPPVNALDQQVTAELLDHLDALTKDETARVIVVTGFGEKAFMAGADIKEFPQLMENKRQGVVTQFVLRSHEMFNKLANFPKPTIAKINGLALGGGCELALACDFRIATEESQLGLPEIKLGIFPGGGGTQRLPRLIGPSRAKELMFTGEFIDANQALQIGLVDHVVQRSELDQKVFSLAEKMTSSPSGAVNLIKQLVNRGTEMAIDEALRLEADYFERALTSNDAKEGVSAFIEKRKANFKHM